MGLLKGEAGPLLYMHRALQQISTTEPKHTAHSFQETTAPLHTLPQSLKSWLCEGSLVSLPLQSLRVEERP